MTVKNLSVRTVFAGISVNAEYVDPINTIDSSKSDADSPRMTSTIVKQSPLNEVPVVIIDSAHATWTSDRPVVTIFLCIRSVFSLLFRVLALTSLSFSVVYFLGLCW